jgi:hypothetical protein
MKNENIVNNQRRIYSEEFAKHGATPKGIFWNDVETQYLRFERLIRNIKPFIEGSTIHDVGSGICDLHKFLTINNIQHKYSGTEIVTDMIDYSLTQYPKIKLFNRDLLSADDNIEKYDFVVLSGTLNLKDPENTKGWKEYCFKLLDKMFFMANKAIVFNFLTSYNTFSKPELMYFKPGEMLDYCITKMSRFSILDHGYPLYETTITVYKKNFIQEQYNSHSFRKYFVQ